MNWSWLLDWLMGGRNRPWKLPAYTCPARVAFIVGNTTRATSWGALDGGWEGSLLFQPFPIDSSRPAILHELEIFKIAFAVHKYSV